MKGILLAATVEGIRTRKDRTVALTLGTQELSPEKAGELFGINNHLITAYLSVKGVTKDEEEIIDSIEPDVPGKSPSQRLRNILFRLWEQQPEGYTDKNLHYIHHLEKICEHYKSKLKP